MYSRGHYLWSDSDESEESDSLVSICSSHMESDAHFDNLVNEADVAKYYKELCDMSISDSKTRIIRSRVKSVSTRGIQTEPDIVGIAPSWIIAGGKMVEGLYIGLRNIINSLYHSPNPADMKNFTYENGYWRSKLLPNIKIPAHMKVDGRMESPDSAHLKKTLKDLLETVTRLRNILPYISDYVDIVQRGSEESGDVRQPKVMLNKCQQTDEEAQSETCLCKFISSLNSDIHSTKLPNTEYGILLDASSTSEQNSMNAKVNNAVNTKETNELKRQKGVAANNLKTFCAYNVDKGISAVHISKCKIHRQTRFGNIPKNTASNGTGAVMRDVKNKKSSLHPNNGLIVVMGKVLKIPFQCKPCALSSEACGSSTEAKATNIRKPFDLNMARQSDEGGAREKIYKTVSDNASASNKDRRNPKLNEQTLHAERKTMIQKYNNALSKNFIKRNIMDAKNTARRNNFGAKD